MLFLGAANRRKCACGCWRCCNHRNAWGHTLYQFGTTGDIPRLNETSVDGRVLAFSIATSLMTGLMSACSPAISAFSAHRRDGAALKQGGSKGTAGTSNRLAALADCGRGRLSVVLLTGAGLLIRSYLVLQAEGTGFSPSPIGMHSI